MCNLNDYIMHSFHNELYNIICQFKWIWMCGYISFIYSVCICTINLHTFRHIRLYKLFSIYSVLWNEHNEILYISQTAKSSHFNDERFNCLDNNEALLNIIRWTCHITWTTEYFIYSENTFFSFHFSLLSIFFIFGD